mgnify:CR=1 FL=1
MFYFIKYYLPPSNSSCHLDNSFHLPSYARPACLGQVLGTCILKRSPPLIKTSLHLSTEVSDNAFQVFIS